MEFIYIPPNELRVQWNWVREGLEAVRAKGHDSWLPEDIYCDCYEQRAMLWITTEKSGFMVLQPTGDSMHLWAAWLKSSDQEDLKRGLQSAIEIAKRGNCKRLTFTSNRRGWEHKAKQLGFKPTMWEIQLGD
jgi:hypothetical protein